MAQLCILHLSHVTPSRNRAFYVSKLTSRRDLGTRTDPSGIPRPVVANNSVQLTFARVRSKKARLPRGAPAFFVSSRLER